MKDMSNVQVTTEFFKLENTKFAHSLNRTVNTLSKPYARLQPYANRIANSEG